MQHRLRNLAATAWLIAAVAMLGVTGCVGGDNNSGTGADAGAGTPPPGGNESPSAGEGVAGAFFGGGQGSADQSGSGDPTSGGGTGNPPTAGGGEGPAIPGLETATPIPVNEAACAVACAGLVTCVSATCELGLADADVAEAQLECVPGCVAQATPQELGAITELISGECAGFTEWANSNALCDEFDDEDFDDDLPPMTGGGTGGTGGTGTIGTPSGDCELFCHKAAECCEDDCLSLEDEYAVCAEVCEFPQLPPEFTAAASCVAQQGPAATCDAVEAACGGLLDDLPDDDIDIPDGPPGGFDCDESTFCIYVECTTSCADDAQCAAACFEEICFSSPSDCACAPSSYDEVCGF